MQKSDFCERLDRIIQQDPRYDREAYIFLRDALNFTNKARKRAQESNEHVTGQQLLEGVRLYALKQFGPMATTVFAYWRVSSCEDFGEIVFSLIRAGSFGKSDSDTLEDFKGGYSFHDAFVAPYLPEKRTSLRQITANHPAEELS